MADFTFSTPANIEDFPSGSASLSGCGKFGNWNLTGDTLTGIVGDPWNMTNDLNRYFYFNPTTTVIPSGAVVVPIQWGAFPNRILSYFSASGSQGNPFQLEMEAVLGVG